MMYLENIKTAKALYLICVIASTISFIGGIYFLFKFNNIPFIAIAIFFSAFFLMYISEIWERKIKEKNGELKRYGKKSLNKYSIFQIILSLTIITLHIIKHNIPGDNHVIIFLVSSMFFDGIKNIHNQLLIYDNETFFLGRNNVIKNKIIKQIYFENNSLIIESTTKHNVIELSELSEDEKQSLRKDIELRKQRLGLM